MILKKWHDNTQHSDILYDDTQHNDTQHKGLQATFNMLTFSIMTLCHYAECLAQCNDLFIAVLNVIMPSVVMLSVMASK